MKLESLEWGKKVRKGKEKISVKALKRLTRILKHFWLSGEEQREYPLLLQIYLLTHLPRKEPAEKKIQS